jgi:multidrug efflux system membrane fusion protein
VVEVRTITSGPTTGDQTIIDSGLAEGERVVVDGQYKLRPNSRVNVEAPAASTVPVIAKRDRAS